MSPTGAGSLMYSTSALAFEVSINGGAYVPLLTSATGAITGTVASNNIPRGAGTSSLQTGSFTDSGTAVSTGSTLTITGVTSLNDTLVLASSTTANNTATFANGSGASASASGSGVLIYDNTNATFDVSTNAGGYVAILTGTPGAVGITGTVASNNILARREHELPANGILYRHRHRDLREFDLDADRRAPARTDTLVLASGTAANNVINFANGSGAAASERAGAGRLIYDNTNATFDVADQRAGAYVALLTGAPGSTAITGTGTNNRTTKFTGHVDRRKRLGVRRRHDVGLGIDLHDHGSVRQHQSVRRTLESAGIFTSPTRRSRCRPRARRRSRRSRMDRAPRHRRPRPAA